MAIQFFKEIEHAAYKYGLDPLMVAAVVRAESNFNPRAVSRAGAVGLMQLMPGTDKWLDGDIDGVDPAGNLDNGCCYLAWIKHLWEMKLPSVKSILPAELWKIVWGSYNAGPGHIWKAAKLSRTAVGETQGLLFDEWKEFLPMVTGKHALETIAYVEKIDDFWKGYILGS